MGTPRGRGLRALALAGAFTLAAQAPASANLIDGPVREVTVTLTEGTNMAAAASPDGGTLVLAIQGALWRLPITGGQAQRLTGWEFEATAPVWSPDGSRIAFQNYNDGHYHIWTIRPDGSDARQLTSGPYDHREPAWSPDGTRIAFASDRADNGSEDIWSIDVQTGALTQWTDAPGSETMPAWSPDGSRIAYATGRFVNAVDAAGNQEQVASIPSGTIRVPAWLPGGGGLAYQNNSRQIVLNGVTVTSGEDIFPFPVSFLPDGSFVYTADGKVRVRSADGTNPRDIAFSAALDLRRPVRTSKDHGFLSKGRKPVRGIFSPVLSPDNSRIAFIALNDLWVMKIGEKPERLTNDTWVEWTPSWSRDGQRIYFSSDRHGGGRPDVYRIDLATRAITRVTVTPVNLVVDPVVSPDERSIAYVDGVNQSLRIHDIASGESRLVVTQAYASNVGKPSWSPDGTRLVNADIRRDNGRFREGRNLIRVVEVETGAWTFHEPGPRPQNLSERFEAGPEWSPDGRWMAFIMDSTLHVMPVDQTGAPTGPARQLTRHAADMPSWGGDSRTILYLSNGRLRTIQVDGSGDREIPVRLDYAPAMPDGVTVIHAGGVWDGISPVIHPNMEIRIAGNRITHVQPIGPGKAKGLQKGDRFIDAMHLIVMPGIWDTHVHSRVKDYTGQWWAVQLAYGITSVVSNGVSTYTTQVQKEGLEAGQLVGPRLFSAPIFDGPRTYYGHHRHVRNEEVLALELDKAKALGMDYLKAYVRAPSSYMAMVARAAQEMGVPSGSHFLTPGIQAGLGGTTHLSATQRMGYSWTSSPASRTYQDAIALYSQGDFHLTSTHGGNAILGNDPSILEDPRFLLLMPPNYVNSLRNSASNPPSPGQIQSILNSIAAPSAILRGGGLVALGTDTPLSAPALGLHAALRAFALGVSNHEALQAATINAARYAHADHELGTVEPGKVADLIMVRGNPLDDVANAASVELVMKNGVTYTIGDILKPYVTTEALAERTRLAAERSKRCRADLAACARWAGEHGATDHGH